MARTAAPFKRVPVPTSRTTSDYFARMREVELLSPEAEKALARKTSLTGSQRALALKHALEDKGRLTSWRKRVIEARLSPEALATEKEAEERFLQHNLRLVVHLAMKRASLGKIGSLTLDDLIQAGSLGLMKAIKKFDWRRGFKFSTYATWWIRQAIQRALYDQARLIRIPVHALEERHKISRVKENWLRSRGRLPTFEEIVQETGLSEERVKITQARHLRQPLSLDMPLPGSDDNSATFGDVVMTANMLEEDLASQAVSNLVQNDLKETLLPLLKKILTERELQLIVLRYGLDGQRAQTLEEVGKAFGLTRERIRQIQDRAEKKLRRNRRMRQAFKGLLL